MASAAAVAAAAADLEAAGVVADEEAAEVRILARLDFTVSDQLLTCWSHNSVQDVING